MASSGSEAERLIAASGFNQKELARELSLRLGRKVEHYTISRIKSGARDVEADLMDALRALVGASPGVAERATPGWGIPRLTSAEQVIPLFSSAAAGLSGLRLGEGSMVGVVPVHPAQQGAVEPFAFTVPDGRLADRLMRGEIAYCLKGRRPVFAGQLCLVEARGGDALPWIYEREDDRTLFVRQNHPKKTEALPFADVAAVHLIVGVTFGG